MDRWPGHLAQSQINGNKIKYKKNTLSWLQVGGDQDGTGAGHKWPATCIANCQWSRAELWALLLLLLLLLFENTEIKEKSKTHLLHNHCQVAPIEWMETFSWVIANLSPATVNVTELCWHVAQRQYKILAKVQLAKVFERRTWNLEVVGSNLATNFKFFACLLNVLILLLFIILMDLMPEVGANYGFVFTQTILVPTIFIWPMRCRVIASVNSLILIMNFNHVTINMFSQKTNNFSFISRARYVKNGLKN